MLFSKQTYTERRAQLIKNVGNGVIVLFGNNGAPCNYPNNTYKFRQDSSFLYYFGQIREGLVGVLDADSGTEWFIGDDIDLEDIVWFGETPSIADMAAECGVANSAPMSKLKEIVDAAKQAGRKVHFLPPYRHDTQIQIMDLLGIHPSLQKASASLELIMAVVNQRAVKTAEEIAEIERACLIGYEMHTAVMRQCRPGVTEQFLSGQITGNAQSYGAQVSFLPIVTMHGEIMHGDASTKPLIDGRLLLCDCGAETNGHYCSDNTRTLPINGKFTPMQRDIYQIVVDSHDHAAKIAKPGMKWLDVHMEAAKVIAEGLKGIGLMKGNVDDAVAAGAHAMFFVHGLGHMMGMDVHDMEGLGQIYVGFDDEVRPSTQFGTNCLRCGRRLQEGWVMTDEPGIYFIPALIDEWQQKGINKEFINFDAVEKYRDFGGIRLEDDLLITADGCRFLGQKRIPIYINEVEEYMNQG